MCGSIMTPGVMVCPTCGEDLTKASMVVSTSVRPLSRSLPRRAIGGSSALYMILAVIVVATAVVGLGYVPSVSARVPQLGTLSVVVEDAVGRAVQWGREMMGQPPAPKQRPATIPKATNSEASKPVAPKPQAVPPALKPVPVTQKPAPVTQKPVAQNPAPKPAPVKKQAHPATKPRPSPPPQKATPTASSQRSLLPIGSRAPQFVVKDLRGVLYRLSDFRGRRVAMLLITSLDESGRTAIRVFASRFGSHSGYHAMIIITHPDRVAVRRLTAAGIGVPILFGDAEVAAAYHVPRGAEALYVISERGAIAQARVFGR